MTTDNPAACPLCGHAPTFSGPAARTDGTEYRCERCGPFGITRQAKYEWRDVPQWLKYEFAFAAMDAMAGVEADDGDAPSRRPYVIDTTKIREPAAKGLRRSTVTERLERLVRWLGDHAVHSNTEFSPGQPRWSEVRAYGQEDVRGLRMLLFDELLATGDPASNGHINALKLTAGGWRRYDELSHGQNSKQAFVAMSFSPELSATFDQFIDPAIREAGYLPRRIDRKEHNNKFDDEIMFEIRRSAFLVADLTEHKNGVYFEAGFALGLGIPVIWTVKAEDGDQTHADTRQYNQIRWKSHQELRERLKFRILNTIATKS